MTPVERMAKRSQATAPKLVMPVAHADLPGYCCSQDGRANLPGRGAQEFCYYLDHGGGQHFNFVQRIWLRPSIPMSMTPVMTTALRTLAVNLLTGMTRERDYRAAVGVTSLRVLAQVDLFCEECLLSSRADGWVIPRATIRAWLASHRPAR
jgi:hypothetical protein